MKRYFSLLMIVVIITSLISGCAGAAATTTATTKPATTTAAATTAAATTATTAAATTKAGKQIVIGLSMSNETPYLTNLRKAAQKKADSLGAKLVVLSAGGNVEKQVNDVESLISQKVDVIILNPTDKAGLGNSVDNIVKAGIKCVEVNTFTTNEKYDVYVGSDDVIAGELQGKWAKENLGTKGGVAILYGVMGHSAQIARLEGLKKTLLDPNPDWKIIADVTGNWKSEEGLRITEDWILKYKDKITLIAAQNDQMALGAYQAVEAAKLQDKIKVIGINGEVNALKSVLEGKLAMSVFQDAFGQGEQCVDVAVGLLNGKKYDKRVLIPFIAITKTNAQQYLDIYAKWS